MCHIITIQADCTFSLKIYGIVNLGEAFIGAEKKSLNYNKGNLDK